MQMVECHRMRMLCGMAVSMREWAACIVSGLTGRGIASRS